MSTAPAKSGTTANYGIRLTSNRMTLMTGVVVFALLGYSIPSNMLTPLLVELEAAYHISAVAAIATAGHGRAKPRAARTVSAGHGGQQPPPGPASAGERSRSAHSPAS